MKKTISVILALIMGISLLMTAFAADQNVSLEIYGGANENDSSSTFNVVADGDSVKMNLWSIADTASAAGAELAKYWNRENIDGMIINLGEYNEIQGQLGEISATEALQLASSYLMAPGKREFTPLTIFNDDGSVLFGKGTLDHLRLLMERSDLADVDSPEKVLGLVETIETMKFIAVIEIIPIADLNVSELPEAQWSALQNSIESDAQVLYLVRSELYMQKGDTIIKLTDNSGVNTTEIINVFNYNDDDSAAENMYVLHVTEDGKTVTNISNVEKSYSSLKFTTHLMGEFFVVNSPSNAPDAKTEPEVPEQPKYLRRVKVNAEELVGASASLDKTEGVTDEDTVTLTVLPYLGRELNTPPVVTAISAIVSEPVVGNDGAYVYQINEIKMNEVITVKGYADISGDAPIAGIKITSLPNRLEYDWSSKALDLDGLVVEALYADGTSAGEIDNSTIDFTGFDTSRNGTKTITANYDGYTVTFEIEVEFTFWQWILFIVLFGWIWM